jgi:hypothetical protein
MCLAMMELVVFGSGAWAESHVRGRDCVRKYYGINDSTSSNVDDVEIDIAPSLATQLLQDIAVRKTPKLNPRAIDCDQIRKATAFQPSDNDGLPANLFDKNFVIYNDIWVRETIGKNRDMAVFIMGHEFGHLLKSHLTTRRETTSFEMESEADYQGACAVALLGGKWSSVEEIIEKLRGDIDTDYPSAATSMKISREAFDDCGGNRDVASQTPNIDVVYFYKRADEGRVVGALNQLGVKSSIRQSGVFRGTDYSDRDTDTVTCHAGVPVDFVKTVALALFDAGVSLRAISEPDPENLRFERRITIEAVAKTRPLLTRDEIENLTRCPMQTDPVFGKARQRS